MITSFIYRSLVWILRQLPRSILNTILLFIRWTQIPSEKFYRDLPYKGIFSVKLDTKSFKLNSNGPIENEIFWKGFEHAIDSSTWLIWQKLCSRNKFIFDIGANTGLFSLMAKAISPEAIVFCFEPSHRIYSKLIRNVESNDFDIKVSNYALSNRVGESTFYDLLDDTQTTASLSYEKNVNIPNRDQIIYEYKVKTITFDAFLNDIKISDVDLVKIDVELHEPEVLQGMERTITQFRPIIILEVLTDDVAKKINAFFSDKNYQLCHISENCSSN